MFIFDFEVFKYDWLVVIKQIDTGEFFIFHNDYVGVQNFIIQHQGELFIGFNNKHYDNHILKAVLAECSPQEIKSVNDYIIADGGNGWEHPLLKGFQFCTTDWVGDENSFPVKTPVKFYSCDLKDDMQDGISLKAIEAHLGMDIEESEVDFNIDRPLTPDELDQTIFYCKYDVNATQELYEIRQDYLRVKQTLGAMRDIKPEVSLGFTNAKLVAKYLLATRIDRNDGRELEYPTTLDLSVIPKEILDFFETIKDTSIPDEILFKNKLEIEIGGCPCVYAWGGVHGSYEKYSAQSTDEIIIQNRDVSSLYPSLMIIYKFISRNCPSVDVFKETYTKRLEAKHGGDKRTAQALKLPLNVTSGATESQYNDLYDPKQARNMRIAGQLFLTELVMKLINKCKTFKLINFNTDGLMYEVNRNELALVDEICSAWEKSTAFELETDNLKKVWIKDVNNLLFVDDKDHIKTVGGYLNYGTSEKGAWSINNNYVIVKKAIIDYFTKDKPLEDTINECTNLIEFQLIAKSGSKFKNPYQLVNGEQVPTQRVNRVYASPNKNFGTLYKEHGLTGNSYKISELPAHCIIDNKNELTISDIDKKWYVKLAQKKVNDYLGIVAPKVNKRKVTSLMKQINKILEV